jgi:hypothetical protein
MDIDAIEPGVDFEEVVNQAVGTCDVLLAVIGRQWLTVADGRGRRRLDNPDDYVRMELQAALERDVRVIPVLVQGVDMPGSDELPDALKRLARRNALEVSTTRWRYDIGRLTAALERIAETAPGQQGGAETAESASTHGERADDERVEHVRAPQGAATLDAANSNRRDSQSQPRASQTARSRNLVPLILLGIIALVGIGVGALVASGTVSHGGSTRTITSASGAGSGGNKPNTANPAPATTTSTVRASLPKHCGIGIDTTHLIPCGLANNVFYEYYMNAQNGGNRTTLAAWSPDTKRYYNASCSSSAGSVKCAVSGTTDPNAEVDLTQAALSAYTPQQANSYAVSQDLGPNG